MPEPFSALRTTATPAQARGGPSGVVRRASLLLFQELKRRNLFRVAAINSGTGWLILNPAHVVFDILQCPAWINRMLLIADLPDWYRILHPPRSARLSSAAGATSKPPADAT